MNDYKYIHPKSGIMKEAPLQDMPILLLIIFLFASLLLFNYLGYRLKKYHLLKNPVIADQADIQNSLLGIMALLLAFSFGIAAAKFETRRQLIIEEANDLGTAILRCDLYPDSIKIPLRKDFAAYLDKRMEYYAAAEKTDSIKNSIKQAQVISTRIWKRVAEASKNKENLVASQLMIPATNAVIDILTTRDSARISKVPQLILYSLLFLCWCCCFITGYNTKDNSRNLWMVFQFVLMITLTLYLVLELDHPRRGLLNLDVAEKNISDLKSMVQ